MFCILTCRPNMQFSFLLINEVILTRLHPIFFAKVSLEVATIHDMYNYFSCNVLSTRLEGNDNCKLLMFPTNTIPTSEQCSIKTEYCALNRASSAVSLSNSIHTVTARMQHMRRQYDSCQRPYCACHIFCRTHITDM